MKKTLFSSTNQPKKNGAKKGVRHIKTIIGEFFNTEIEWEEVKGKPKKMLAIDAMVAAQLKKAYKDGDLGAFKELSDRYYGKVKEKHEHSGDMIINYGHRRKEVWEEGAEEDEGVDR